MIVLPLPGREAEALVLFTLVDDVARECGFAASNNTAAEDQSAAAEVAC